MFALRLYTACCLSDSCLVGLSNRSVYSKISQSKTNSRRSLHDAITTKNTDGCLLQYVSSPFRHEPLSAPALWSLVFLMQSDKEQKHTCTLSLCQHSVTFQGTIWKGVEDRHRLGNSASNCHTISLSLGEKTVTNVLADSLRTGSHESWNIRNHETKRWDS